MCMFGCPAQFTESQPSAAAGCSCGTAGSGSTTVQCSTHDTGCLEELPQQTHLQVLQGNDKLQVGQQGRGRACTMHSKQAGCNVHVWQRHTILVQASIQSTLYTTCIIICNCFVVQVSRKKATRGRPVVLESVQQQNHQNIQGSSQGCITHTPNATDRAALPGMPSCAVSCMLCAALCAPKGGLPAAAAAAKHQCS